MYTAAIRNINLDVDPSVTFEPGMFSIPELHFLADHVKDASIVAFHDFDPEGDHKGVMRTRVEPMLDIFQQLEQLRQARSIPWAGFDAIQDAIVRFLDWHARSLEIARRSRQTIRNPSMFTWDDTGYPHKYAIDADSGEMVRTEIADDGSRKPFAVRLQLSEADVLHASLKDVLPWVTGKRGEIVADKLTVDTSGKIGFIECSVCKHREEFAKTSAQQKSAARARMSQHLKRAKVETNRHRLLYTKSFR